MTETSLVMTAAEVAAALGLEVKTVRAAAGRGEIPCRRIGRRMIFPRCAIEAWLAETSATIVSPASRRPGATRR